MRQYNIGFYNVLKDDDFTAVIVKQIKCDANALRIIATKMQHNTIMSISFYTQCGKRYVMVRYC